MERTTVRAWVLLGLASSTFVLAGGCHPRRAATTSDRGRPVAEFAAAVARADAPGICDRPETIYSLCGHDADFCLGHVQGVMLACATDVPEMFPRYVTPAAQDDVHALLLSCTGVMVLETLAGAGCEEARVRADEVRRGS